MNSTGLSALGTLNLNTSTFPLASLVPLLYEWAAILPLAIYLANPDQTHQLVGKASLSEHICTAPFPKLGVLAHIAQLLQEGPDFLDRVSAIGGLRHEVWDANWGSVFPCANGSASRIIAAKALRKAKTVVISESIILKEATGGASVSTASSSSESASVQQTAASTCSPSQPASSPDPGFRRYQTLHVLQFNRATSAGHKNNAPEAKEVLNVLFEVVLFVGLTAAVVLSLMFGLYGTAVCLLVGIVVRLSCRRIVLERAKLYLQDNEEGKMDGCMLSAVHQNASTWYLYIGDRGIIDGMLNKPMIVGVAPAFAKSIPMVFVYFIKFLSMLQLAAVTYVTAQKGWDSVGLLSLILFSMILDALWDNQRNLARAWLRKHGVRIESAMFLFSGRVAMLGAIQALKRTDESSWMDGILQQNACRDAFLSGLSGPQMEYKQRLASLDDGDRKGVQRNVELARQAAELIRASFTTV
ncbi:hypothetical protein BDW74DRAFT_175992 [Aspergillus multicolor]|uniref:uncharacterized protein n=1 Tax=Aspergillus multicolor TaxID=41759 RepID=UPI003CCD6B72